MLRYADLYYNSTLVLQFSNFLRHRASVSRARYEQIANFNFDRRELRDLRYFRAYLSFFPPRLYLRSTNNEPISFPLCRFIVNIESVIRHVSLLFARGYLSAGSGSTKSLLGIRFAKINLLAIVVESREKCCENLEISSISFLLSFFYSSRTRYQTDI